MSAPEQLVYQTRRFVRERFRDPGGCANLYAAVVGIIEKPMIEAVLQRFNGNISHAALALGINRNTLRKLMTRHGVGR